jgi:hypothetical protein
MEGRGERNYCLVEKGYLSLRKSMLGDLTWNMLEGWRENSGWSEEDHCM